MPVPFITVDVFTDRPFGGNPLAVLPDAKGLTDSDMQAIAAEFNLAETAFVLPPDNRANTAKVRIFTPKAELPFAGHPNIGTAWVLATLAEERGSPLAEPLVFEQKAGLVKIELVREGGRVSGARLDAPQPLIIFDELSLAAVAAMSGLEKSDIVTSVHPPLVASTGVRMAFAQVKDIATLSRISIRTEAFLEHMPSDVAVGLNLYVRSPSEGLDIQTRAFGPLFGIPEDPATGSANLTLTALLTQMLPDSDCSVRLRIAQGVEMGRPSLLIGEAEKAGGKLVRIQVGGGSIRMSEGLLHWP